MRTESITVTAAQPRRGVLTLSGYGIRVAVEHGHLIVEDGRGRERRQGRFPRATRDLKRLAIIGHSGSVTLDALRWLHDIGCRVVQIDRDGTLISASCPMGLDDARLRRAQAIARDSDTGLAIARDLLARKLDGQAELLESLSGGTAAAGRVRRFRDALATAITIDGLRTIEAQAAATYWLAWAHIPVRFARKAIARVPEHWQTVGTRSSPLTGSPRTAANPANAILNYLYAIAEAETRIALLTVGLDPGMGIVHADQRARDSFACDVMEAIRPEIDRYVLDMLTTRPLGTGDVFETRQGACRLLPSITRLLAETAPRWALAVAPIVEHVAESLMSGKSPASQRRSPTPLTQANRSAGRAAARKRSAQNAPIREPATLPAACQECGVILDDTRRAICDACLPGYRRTHGTEAFAAAGPATLKRRRDEGIDPAHGEEAGKQRGQRNARHVAAAAIWEQEHGAPSGDVAGSELFTRDILPMLQTVSLRSMADATGLTQGYCSFVRRGLKVPHRRHWAALERLTTGMIDNRTSQIERRKGQEPGKRTSDGL